MTKTILKKVIIPVILIILVVSSIFSLSSCGDSAFKDEDINIFFADLCKVVKRQEDIKVNSVTAYFFEKSYFYNVSYSFYNKYDNDWVALTKVKVFNGTLYDVEFIEDKGDSTHPYEYKKYLKAKQEGKKKSFSDSEIKKYVENYFNAN